VHLEENDRVFSSRLRAAGFCGAGLRGLPELQPMHRRVREQQLLSLGRPKNAPAALSHRQSISGRRSCRPRDKMRIMAKKLTRRSELADRVVAQRITSRPPGAASRRGCDCES
jgi:hypothetical protein